MMNECNNCSKCSSCDPCGGCKPACYKPYFNLQADPFNPDYWLWEMGGESGKIKLPKLNETDTTLSTNYSNATLNYKAERHNDVITGEQLGSLINLDDLRDVDANSPDACSILVFNPGCGACPCSPDEERWKKYHIPDATTEATADSDGFYHVLAKTDCGCITETKIPEMPNYKCLIQNLINAIKPFGGEGQMIDVQGGGSTPGFTGGLNPNTGEFYISWYDYDSIDTGSDAPIGQGRVNGRMTVSSRFNIDNGSITYTISQIYYDKMTYHPLYSGTIPSAEVHTVWGCFPGTHDLSASHETLTAQGLRLFTYTLWGGMQTDVSASINKTFTGNMSFTVPAGGTSSWITVMRLYNDWVADDDGLVRVRYTNPLNWSQC